MHLPDFGGDFLVPFRVDSELGDPGDEQGPRTWPSRILSTSGPVERFQRFAQNEGAFFFRPAFRVATGARGGFLGLVGRPVDGFFMQRPPAIFRLALCETTIRPSRYSTLGRNISAWSFELSLAEVFAGVFAADHLRYQARLWSVRGVVRATTSASTAWWR